MMTDRTDQTVTTKASEQMTTTSVGTTANGISRRGFLVAGAVGAATVSVLHGAPVSARADAEDGPVPSTEEVDVSRPAVALDDGAAPAPSLPSHGIAFLR
jgi:hypothetical protein